jgi:hypothetical protein
VKRRDDYATYLFLAGMVALVAAVGLLVNTEGISGALSVSQESDDYQKYCTDSDPANYFNVQGVVKLRDEVYKDHCDGKYLHQQFCRSRKHVSHTRPLLCENGCSNGVCL